MLRSFTDPSLTSCEKSHFFHSIPTHHFRERETERPALLKQHEFGLFSRRVVGSQSDTRGCQH